MFDLRLLFCRELYNNAITSIPANAFDQLSALRHLLACVKVAWVAARPPV